MMKKIILTMMVLAFSFPAFAECKTDKGCDLKKASHSAKNDCDECSVPDGLPRCCGKSVCSDAILKMSKELGLTEDQKAKLTQINQNTASKNAVLKKKLADKKTAMMSAAASNSKSIERLIRAKHSLKAQIHINKYRAHAASMKVLTPEQIAKLAPKKKGIKAKDCKSCK